LFASSFWIRNRSLSAETRLEMGKLGGLLDMGPRSSLILILLVGVLLTYFGGFAFTELPVWVIWAVTAVMLLWLWAVWQQHLTNEARLAGHPVGWRIFFSTTFRTIDLCIRVGLALLLIGVGVMAGVGILGQDNVVGWLNTKIALFGVIILCGVAIRIVSDGFPAALGEIVRLGSTPDREHRLNTALVRAYPFVITLWVIVLVLLVLGVTKPF
ncbi:MAG: hypothetical protein NZ518_11600, partial [Dehalococcoidia bacterium]|nr:hypothetical protein [Dehalococcoidia bacterium]